MKKNLIQNSAFVYLIGIGFNSTATTGLSSLEGLAQALEVLVLLVSVVAAFFLGLAYSLKHKRGRITKSVLTLTVPVLAYFAFTYCAVFYPYPDAYVLSIIGVSIALGIGLIWLFVGARLLRIRLTFAFIITSGILVLINPAIVNVWIYEEVASDPFDGKGVSVIDVITVGGYYHESWGKGIDDINKWETFRVDQVVVLEDGRRLPGIFTGLGSTSIDQLSPVVVEQEWFGQYPIKVTGFTQQQRQSPRPMFDVPLFKRTYELNKTYMLGRAYKIEEAPERHYNSL